MRTLKQARKKAELLTKCHKEKWVVIRLPKNCPAMQRPLNIYNTGSFEAIRESELADFVAGGCQAVPAAD